MTTSSGSPTLQLDAIRHHRARIHPNIPRLARIPADNLQPLSINRKTTGPSQRYPRFPARSADATGTDLRRRDAGIGRRGLLRLLCRLASLLLRVMGAAPLSDTAASPEAAQGCVFNAVQSDAQVRARLDLRGGEGSTMSTLIHH